MSDLHLDDVLAGPASRSLQNVLRTALASGDELRLIVGEYGAALSSSDPDKTSHVNVIIGGVTCKIPQLSGAGGAAGSPAYVLATKDGLLAVGTLGGGGGAGIPIGGVIPFGSTVAPTGFLLCDGASYLRATYSLLFAAIGTAFGAADSTHFNVPDLRRRFPLGWAVSGLTGFPIGTTGNEDDGDGDLGRHPLHWHTYSTSAPLALTREVEAAPEGAEVVEVWTGGTPPDDVEVMPMAMYSTSPGSASGFPRDGPSYVALAYVIRAT